MDKFEKIDAAIKRHQELANELEAEITALKADDLYSLNEELQKKLSRSEQELKDSLAEADRLSAENKRLKNELYEQLFNEKANILKASKEQIDAYFALHSGEENRLSALEARLKAQIDEMKSRLLKNRINLDSAASAAVLSLKEQVSAAVLAAKKEEEQMRLDLLKDKDASFEALRGEPLTEAQIVKRSKQNNFESFLGLKILNKLGIFLIIIGVIAAVQFSYTYIPDTLKGALSFLLGALMLGFGEFLSRKRANVFSVGLTSGGIAILYAATALSFFLLHIISMYIALLLCVLITALAFVLSQRYNAQTIACFAAIGGYLPLLSITSEGSLVFYAMGYFFLLNIFSLLTSIYKKWQVSHFVGFSMNFFATLYVLSLLLGSESPSAKYFAVVYSFLAFVVFTAVPVLHSFKTGAKLKPSDNVLIILNTILSSFIMLYVFSRFGLWDSAGIMSIILCLFYLFAATVIYSKLKEEKTCLALFYITGITFAVLAIPIQLGTAYLSLGWLIQGVLLLSYGIFAENRAFKKAGIVISSLCLAAFILFDLFGSGNMLYFKYLCLTLGSLVVFSILMLKGKINSGAGQAFKCAAYVNLWFFILVTCSEKIRPPLPINPDDLPATFLLLPTIIITLSLLLSYTVSHIKKISDFPVRVISVFIYIISVIALIFTNIDSGDYYLPNVSPSVSIICTIALIAVNLLAVFALRDLILNLTLDRKLSLEWYPLILSSFFVFVTLQNMIAIFGLALNNVLVTCALALTAIGWIIFGFKKRYQYIRLCGLGLSFLATIKLFIIDLSFLTEGARIVSYFVMGLSLLTISFVYQLFSKKLDAKKEEEKS